MTEMGSKLILITPEIILFAGSVLVAVLGLSRSRSIRGIVPWTTIGFIAAAVMMVIGMVASLFNPGRYAEDVTAD